MGRRWTRWLHDLHDDVIDTYIVGEGVVGEGVVWVLNGCFLGD